MNTGHSCFEGLRRKGRKSTRLGFSRNPGSCCAGLSTLLCGLLGFVGSLPITAALAAEDHASKTLNRSRDPLIMEGKALAGLFDGDSSQALAVFAYGEDGFRQVPCQFDFIGEDKLVICRYVNRVRKKAVYDFMPNEKFPTRVSGHFQLLFMAKDTGDRYPGPSLPPGFSKAAEIEVKDPMTSDLGWAYLMKTETPPPGVRDDYVDYVLIRKGPQSNEQIRAKSYTAGFPDADKPFAYGYWAIPKNAGGTGENILQTFRIRVYLRLLGLSLELDPKNNIIPYVLGYNDGPVRVTRRAFSSVVVKGIKMDWLMGGASLETESHYYRDYFYFDGEVSVPGAVKKVSKIKAIFTTDFLQTASGMVWSNSENASAGGCLVDGRMSPQEQALADGAYSWSLLVGPQGGWANILQMHTAFVWRNMRLFYLDDSSYRYEKDPDINGTWGSTGYYMDKVDKVEDKVTFRTNIFAIPNSFTSPETRHLLQIVEHPLETVVRRTWGAEVNGDDPPPEEER